MNGIPLSRDLLHKYAHLLQDCIKSKDIITGMCLHAHMCETSIDSNLILGNTLLHMYAKCGCVRHARGVFDNMQEHNVFSWTAIISAYADHGPAEEAFHLYQGMRKSGLKLDKDVYLSIFKACVSLRCLIPGMCVHAHVIISCFESDIFIANSLIDMYAKCWHIDHAQQVFCALVRPDIISWNIIMTGCLLQGLHAEAFAFYIQLQMVGMQPNSVTYMLALKACTGCASLNNACGEEGLVSEAFSLLNMMKERGFKPDEITFSVLLKVCTHLATIEDGRCLHFQLVESCLNVDVFATSVLIDMYMKHDSHVDACRVFENASKKDITAWNAMIAGFNENCLSEKNYSVFEKFLAEGNLPDRTTIMGMLKACLHLAEEDRGKAIRVYVIEMGLLSDLSSSNSILQMFVSYGSLQDASEVLAHMLVRDVVSWNTLIVASIQQGLGEIALVYFGEMLREGIKPTHITFSSVLKVCASLPNLEWGMEIHKLANLTACECFISVGSALVDMYAKCGMIDDARRMFDSMGNRQLVAWTAIIAGCALQGLCKEALELFEKMINEGVKPDSVTFVAVLSACSRAGLLDVGCYYFIFINSVCQDAVTSDHVACMVDLLARAGQLQVAQSLVFEMPVASDDVVWMVLLDACRIHGDVDMGRYAYQSVLRCDPSCSQA